MALTGTSYDERVQALQQALLAAPRGAPVRLHKRTSNLFRPRDRAASPLDADGFVGLLDVDVEGRTADVLGMTTYEELVDATLPHGLMPLVVPQLKTITLGGAVAGVGIEASSHRYGLVHETVEELEVLTGEGRIVTCRRDNEHADLFFGFPNSYGTLGYALRVVARAVPVRPFVHLEHLPFDDAGSYFKAVERHCVDGDADFVDGTIFAPDRMYLTLGRFTDAAPATSDYTYRDIYYRSIEKKREDWLTTHDFIWRWDTDWFWCSKNLLAQNPLVRRLYGPRRLGSRTYSKIMRWNSRIGLTRSLDQDVDVPVERAPAFLDFLAREVGIWPVWMCPIGPGAEAPRFPLYPMERRLYVNFGFWDVVRSREARGRGHVNRAIEREVAAAGGIKSLYSESYYPREEFDARYGGAAYAELKAKYDPRGAFPTLYEKCVLRH